MRERTIARVPPVLWALMGGAALGLVIVVAVVVSAVRRARVEAGSGPTPTRRPPRP